MTEQQKKDKVVELCLITMNQYCRNFDLGLLDKYFIRNDPSVDLQTKTDNYFKEVINKETS